MSMLRLPGQRRSGRISPSSNNFTCDLRFFSSCFSNSICLSISSLWASISNVTKMCSKIAYLTLFARLSSSNLSSSDGEFVSVTRSFAALERCGTLLRMLVLSAQDFYFCPLRPSGSLSSSYTLSIRQHASRFGAPGCVLGNGREHAVAHQRLERRWRR